MPTFKSISKSNKPNNSIVNYAINDVNTVAIVTKDGEIIDKKDVLVMYANSKSHKQLIDEQKKRLYFKVFIDTLGNIYNLTNNEELYLPGKEELFNERIYITRGGVVSGEYINKCYIKNSNFYPRDPVTINCSRITNYEDINIYTIDSRSPKLKVLKEFYNVSINIDDKYKYIDIRKFKKL